MSDLKTEWQNTSAEIDTQLRGALIQWETETLRQRIAERTKLMLKSGAIEEVNSQAALSITCEKAIGVPQIRAYLSGDIDLATCEEKIFFATCQYAKRQRTWFKKENWLTPIPFDSATDITSVAESFVELLD